MIAHPEVLVQLRNKLVADAEGFNVHRRQHRSTRVGEGVEIRRSPQAVACRKRCVREPGKPQGAPVVGTGWARHTAIEARKGKPGNGTMLEPKRSQENHEPGGRDRTGRPVISICPWGVLSGIVL